MSGTYKRGDRVRALYPNQTWGTGVVVETKEIVGLKKVVVRRADGSTGYFQHDQLEALEDTTAEAAERVVAAARAGGTEAGQAQFKVEATRILRGLL